MDEVSPSDAPSLEEISIQVCYATVQQQTILELIVPRDTSIAQAIELSQILKICPEIQLSQSKFGIFGKLKSSDTLLRRGDRVEIYRPLIADPMEARRRRAQKQTKE